MMVKTGGEGVSNCCGASIIHGDFCSECFEHCEVVDA
jgi:hypothetical protein